MPGPVTRLHASVLLAQADSDNPEVQISGETPLDHPPSSPMAVEEVSAPDDKPSEPGSVDLSDSAVPQVNAGGSQPAMSSLAKTERTAVEDELAHLRKLVDDLKGAMEPSIVAETQRYSHTRVDGSSGQGSDRRPADGSAGANPVGVTGLRKLQTFDGSVSWEAYHAQFELVARHNRWSGEEKAVNLAASLAGPALELLGHMDIERRLQYDALVDAIERRFGCSHREHLYRAELRKRVRSANEELSKLADDIEKLAFRAYPSAPSHYRAVLACDHFIDALADETLQIAVRQSRPSSLSQALVSALEIESIRRSANVSDRATSSGAGFRLYQATASDSVVAERNSQPRSVPDQFVQDILRRIEQLETTMRSSPRGSDTGRGRYRSSGGRQTSGCWRCGQAGHFRRDCRVVLPVPPVRNSARPQSEN